MLAIHPTAADVAHAVASEIEHDVLAAQHLTIGLAGGSTPEATYALLAERPIDWNKTTLWLGDERWVAADHPDANTGMVRRTLGDRAAERLLAPDYTLGDPEIAAAAYDETLRRLFERHDTEARPGLVLLGLGDDGHTASLFPGTAALDVRDRHYVANWVDAKQTWRLSATLPLLWAARKVAFIVTGEGKASMVARIIDGSEPFPAQRVAAGNGAVTWYLDEAAASRLGQTPPITEIPG